jgi:hypothetical protein
VTIAGTRIAPREQIEATIEPLQKLLGRQETHAACREFEREWDSVEPTDEVGQHARIDSIRIEVATNLPSARDEESDRFGSPDVRAARWQRERADVVRVFRVEAQSLLRCDQEPRGGRGRSPRCENVATGREEPLEVVEHDEACAAPRNDIAELRDRIAACITGEGGETERASHDGERAFEIACRREVRVPDAAGERVCMPMRIRDREPRLSDAGRAEQRDDRRRAAVQERVHRGEIVVATDESARIERQRRTGRRDRSNRRRAACGDTGIASTGRSCARARVPRSAGFHRAECTAPNYAHLTVLDALRRSWRHDAEMKLRTKPRPDGEI